eukprot:994319-Rhodomonas_salina.2
MIVEWPPAPCRGPVGSGAWEAGGGGGPGPWPGDSDHHRRIGSRPVTVAVKSLRWAAARDRHGVTPVGGLVEVYRTLRGSQSQPTVRRRLGVTGRASLSVKLGLITAFRPSSAGSRRCGPQACQCHGASDCHAGGRPGAP